MPQQFRCDPVVLEVYVQHAAVATEKVRIAEENAEELREALKEAEGADFARDLQTFSKKKVEKSIEGCIQQARAAREGLRGFAQEDTEPRESSKAGWRSVLSSRCYRSRLQ